MPAFRLRTLLRLRESERDDRRLDLARALEAERILERQIDQASDEIRGLDELQRIGSGPVDVEVQLEAARHKFVLRLHRESLLEKRVQVQAEIERRRQALVEADREVKKLEKLRDLQAQRFADEERKGEQKELDEIALRLPRNESQREIEV
jgi:flagellar export protein FliJ